jgi:hypothetical protein
MIFHACTWREEMNSRQYPQFLTANPMVFGISIKFLMAMATLTGMGSILRGSGLIDVRPDLVLGLAFALCFLVSIIQKNAQGSYLYFVFRQKKVLDWISSLSRKGPKKNLEKKYYLYELELMDLEQKEISDIEDLVSRMKNNLNTFKTENYYRIYHLNSCNPIRTFLVTNDSNFYLYGMGIKAVLNEDPEIEKEILSILFGGFDKKMPFLSNIIVNHDAVKINDRYWRFVNVYKMADTELLKFQSYGHDYVLCFKKVGSERAKINAKQKRRFHYSNVNSSIRDIESEASYLQNEALLEDLIHGKRSLFDAEIWFIVKSDTLEELRVSSLDLCKQLTFFNQVHG